MADTTNTTAAPAATQPAALRLADALQNAPLWESQAPLIAGFSADSDATLEEAAAELRRLHALTTAPAAQEAEPVGEAGTMPGSSGFTMACFHADKVPLGTKLYAAPQAPAAAVAPFQQRVQPWMMACFGAEISADREERNHRFLEEALELVQSCGCSASEAHQLVDYVYGRPVGEPVQEVGGVMVTLAALCLANGLDMHAAGETELARIWTKVDAIRAKQAAKPKHSPLPAATAVAPAYADSTPHLHVGESAFEDWFQRQQPFTKWGSVKQIARDAYAAGMGDPLLAGAPAQEADGWMSIETAPKGKRILVFSAEIGRCVASAGWNTDTPEAIRWEVVNDICVNPTHWRPLPASPAARARQEGAQHER